MSLLKILPSAVDTTANFTFGNVTTTSIISNGVDLGVTLAAAFSAANNSSDSFARQTANAATTLAQSAFDSANVIIGVNTTQNTNITVADTKAQAAFNSSNTKLSTSGGTITGNLVVNAFTANSITANGVDLGTAVASAFILANNASKTTTSNTAPSNPNVGDMWYDTVMNVTLRYTNDGVSNNWVDITGPQNAGYIYQTYSLTPNTTTINETTSNTVIYTVTTTNNADNTVLYWTNSGTTSAADFSDATSNGTVTITNNSGTITRRLVADVATEGDETIILSLRTGSNSGPIVAVASSVTVTDTSVPPAYKLYSWGFNGYANLGLNEQGVYRSSPTQVGTDTTWSLIAPGMYNTFAKKTNNTLWAWGKNDAFGQSLGLNNLINQSSPVQIGTDTNWNKLSCNFNHTLATRSDNSLWGWGRNERGGLGKSDIIDRSSPVQIGTSTDWSTISAGYLTSGAVKTNGTLWLWGYSAYGLLANNDYREKSSPSQVGVLTNWSTISHGRSTVAAIKTNGTLWVWGLNNRGQLGQNNTVNVSSPVQVGAGTNWLSVSVGGYNNIVATKTDGTLWTWGNNDRGQLGLNDTTRRSSPVQVGVGTTWLSVKSGYMHVMAEKTDGTLWSWGWNPHGSLGLNDTANRSSPVQIGSNITWGTIGTGSVSYSSFVITSG